MIGSRPMPDRPSRPDAAVPFADELLAELAARSLTIAVAESLTGGLLTAELIRPPGASSVVLGGIVAYDTELKHSLLDVDAELLERHGPVHPEVARQLASGARTRLAVGGRAADIGIATTGVAGPDPQQGQSPGTVFLGLARDSETLVRALTLSGTRDEIRAATVTAALEWIAEVLRE